MSSNQIAEIQAYIKAEGLSEFISDFTVKGNIIMFRSLLFVLLALQDHSNKNHLNWPLVQVQ